ncbi:hypothetical protein CCHR01_16586 [Colletotrichum chrysophilum]|uniref:Uncharacterized protein n=1 Tax=Colletotrichum chrysophilum TaxID=1836956 RepID=A0AAD9E7N8_9PEZI|nr:hypothetical protein CCHR01_16586 [Colletotrichum chrysophilum]
MLVQLCKVCLVCEFVPLAESLAGEASNGAALQRRRKSQESINHAIFLMGSGPCSLVVVGLSSYEVSLLQTSPHSAQPSPLLTDHRQHVSDGMTPGGPTALFLGLARAHLWGLKDEGLGGRARFRPRTCKRTRPHPHGASRGDHLISPSSPERCRSAKRFAIAIPLVDGGQTRWEGFPPPAPALRAGHFRPFFFLREPCCGRQN